jgi:hypothetical protein
VEFAAQQQVLQDRLIVLKAHADSADHELAAAVRSAVGGPASGGVPDAGGGERPRSLENMLLPAGSAESGGGNGSPSNAHTPVAGTAGKPSSLQDLLLPTGRQPNSGQGDQPPSGSLSDLLSRLDQPVVPGAPLPRLKPAEVDSFKATARQTLARDGVPPDQIEARLNDIVCRTQQWIDNGMPNYVPPEPKPPPPPGFGEGFGDRWFATEQGIKNLIGQGGPGAPGGSSRGSRCSRVPSRPPKTRSARRQGKSRARSTHPARLTIWAPKPPTVPSPCRGCFRRGGSRR